MPDLIAANKRISIPVGKDVFIPLNPQGINPVVFIRDGNTFKRLDLQAIAIQDAGGLVPCGRSNGFSCFADTGEQIDNASQIWQRGIDLFNKQTGLDYFSLPQQNIADVEGATRGGQATIQPLNSINDFKSTLQTAQSGGDIDISQGQRVNAQGQLVDASGKVIAESVTAPEAQATIVNTPVTLGNGETVFVDTQGNFFDTSGKPVSNKQIASSTATNGMTQVTLGNGQTVQVDNQGNFFDLSGNPVSNEQVAGATAGSAIGSQNGSTGDTGASGGTSGGTTGGTSAITGQPTELNFSDLENSPEYQALDPDLQQVVRAVFEGVAQNDVKLAQRFAEALKVAGDINDPFFASLARLAKDALTRGFVSLDNEEAVKEEQLRNTLADLRTDIANRSEFLSLEEQNTLKGIERKFVQNLEDTRQGLATRGFTSSSRRSERERVLEEDRSDIVESTGRKFAFEQEQIGNQLAREERDTQAEIARLSELAREGRLDLLRKAEESLGSQGLGDLTALSGLQPLGDVFGSLPQEELESTISAAQSFVF